MNCSEIVKQKQATVYNSNGWLDTCLISNIWVSDLYDSLLFNSLILVMIFTKCLVLYERDQVSTEVNMAYIWKSWPIWKNRANTRKLSQYDIRAFWWPIRNVKQARVVKQTIINSKLIIFSLIMWFHIGFIIWSRKVVLALGIIIFQYVK